MSAYYPEGVNMNDVDKEFDSPTITLPDVPDPLELPELFNAIEAGEVVAAYLYLTSGDTDRKLLQWHAAQVQIFPWSIPYTAFCDLVNSLPPEFPTFDNDAEADEFMWTIENALTKVEDN